MTPLPPDRRRFLAAGAALAALAADAPPGPRRATSGDRVEPEWQERLTLTVGPKTGDLVGSSEKAIQAAVDAVARLGGGTVKLLPGTYKLRNAVWLASRVRLLGSGADTVLIKEPSASTKLKADSDWFDQEITLVDASSFRVGDGVCLRAKNPHTGATTVVKRTLVARTGNRFKLDRALRENLWLTGEATAASLFPLVTAEHAEGFAIEELVLDGNRANNEQLDGNHAGCVFLQDCRDVTIRGVTARSYNGDGMSWQICHDVLVEGCTSEGHAMLGLHPGSGSQRPVVRGNTLRHNTIGLFFCWGVRFGVAEKNTIEDSKQAGVSIGHRDTDNLIKDNVILRSGQAGVLFRPERGPTFAAHRNKLVGNRVENSGAAEGVAIDVQGGTEQVTISGNQLKETRAPDGHVGIRLGEQTKDIKVENNRIDGFAVPVADLRKA
jgi:hypothetical protein